MKKTNMKWILSLLFILPACSYFEYQEPVYQVLPYQEDMIGLQNLETRVLVYCYHSDSIPTEECAQEFEKRGYVRLTNIPRLTAEYDYLKADSYPTRRWRKDEKIPRW